MTMRSNELEYRGFNPASYLREYYSSVGEEISRENDWLLGFMARTYADLPRGGRLLEVGGGPTIWQLISAAAKVDSIVFTDNNGRNIAEIAKWNAEDDQAYNWDPFFRRALALEKGKRGGNGTNIDREIEQRKKMLRSKLIQFSILDILRPGFTGSEWRDSFDFVSSHFLGESITPDKKEWKKIIANTCAFVKPGGNIIISALRNALYYNVDGESYRAVNISDGELIMELERNGFSNFDHKSVYADEIDRTSSRFEGFSGVICVRGTKIIPAIEVQNGVRVGAI